MQQYLQSIYQQLVRFGVTGLINTGIDFSIFNLLLFVTAVDAPWQVGLINAFAVTAAAANSYLLNRHWTFAAAAPPPKSQLFRFLVATSGGLVLSSALVTGVGSLAVWLPLPAYMVYNAGKLLGGAFGAGWNFFVYRNWVFNDGTSNRQVKLAADGEKGLISLIIPAYNEAARLPARLQQLQPCLNAGMELIVVDDGSSDDTRLLADEFAQQNRGQVKVVCHPVNRGKGAAVASGMAAARGEYLIFSDADTTFSPAHISFIASGLKNGSQVVIGCRQAEDGKRMAGEGKLRQAMGRGFNLLVQALTLPGITDSQCGLKGFSRPAAAALFSRQRIPGFAFDVELLALARRLGYTIQVVKVKTVDCDGSSVKCWRAVLAMGNDVLRIRWGLSWNYYGLVAPVSGFSWRLAGALFLSALAVRLPWLWEVPRYIDELREVNLAYSIYLGQVLPLTNVAYDIGPLHNYILAAIFKFLGPSIYWPRLYMALTSALTIVVVYEIGRRLFGRTTGLLAAGLLLTNGMHIMVTHMAWSNSSTPFFFVLALLTLLMAEEKKSGCWLAASALLWAAALQTHSSVIIYVLAAGIYVLSPRFRLNSRISWRWYAAGLGAFLLAYANMIYFNLITRGASFSWVGRKTYTLEMDPGLASFLHNSGQMGMELLRALGAIYMDPTAWTIAWPLPWVLMVLAVLIFGLIRGLKAGKILPALMILGAFLIIPWINHRYSFYLATRYIMPVIICSQLYLAAGAVELVKVLPAWLEHKWVRAAGCLKTVFGLRRPTIVYALLVGLLTLQVVPFYRHCARLLPTNESNHLVLNIMDIISASAHEKRVVLLDSSLPLDNEPMPYLLKLSRQPFITVDGMPDTFNWSEFEQKYPHAAIYAIMSTPAYKHLIQQITPAQVHQLQTRVSIPHPNSEPRQIYVLRLTDPEK